MMSLFIKLRTAINLSLDILVGFLALTTTLLIRYGKNDFNSQLSNHIELFIIVVGIFLASFYIFNLYSIRFNRNITEFTDSFVKSIIVSFLASILLLYIFSGRFSLAPKTNLVIFTVIFSLLDFYIRIMIKRFYSRRNINRKIVIVNNGDKNDFNLINEIKNNQNMGYEVIKELSFFNYQEILEINPDTLIINSIEKEKIDQIYSLSKNDILVKTTKVFYEETFQKIPIETIDNDSIIGYINKPKKLFTTTKRFIDIVISILFLIVLSPLLVIVALIIKVTSKGPILFKQTRVSINDELFTIYKFRSMYIDSEKDGPVWTTDDRTDKRITPLGRILRKTHIDEIPQIINILSGDLSIVGPRPERPEFTKMLDEKVLHYNLRHAVKPGLTGWAQVNYRYGASVADAEEKLKYDFYYIKNRNIFFDFLIVLKTIAMILKKH